MNVILKQHPSIDFRISLFSRLPGSLSRATRQLQSQTPHQKNVDPHSITTTDRSALRNNDSHSTESGSNARVQREPNYSGWWTEVMKVRLEPQQMPDPSLNLSEGHVFVGKPADAAAQSDPSIGARGTKSSNELPTPLSNGSSAASEMQGASSRSSLGTASDFYDYQGYKIPVKPTPPGSEDCCMSGCAVCVYDIYEEDRQAYKEQLSVVLKQLEVAGIPPPPDLANKNAQSASDKLDDMDPSMKAFLELERKLKGG